MPSLLSPLNIPAAKSGDWEIVVRTEKPGTEFKTASMRCQMFGGQKSKAVSWPHETRWHYLKEGGGTWMSDIPCEHAQMLSCIKGMEGRVLVGGLGLGLAATLLACKKSVRDVTVVEKSPDVIELVYEHIRQREILGNKIIVCEGDLFAFLKDYQGKPFDYALYDIWQSDGEGTFFHTVCPLYDLSRGKVKNFPVNWNEDVMRGQLMGSLSQRMLFARPGVMEQLDPEGRMAKHPKLWEPLPEDRGGSSKSAIFWNWAVPFFRWWKETEPDEERATFMARYYAGLYGIWDWEKRWKRLLKVHPGPAKKPPTELVPPDAGG